MAGRPPAPNFEQAWNPTAAETRPVPITAVPYQVWANREPGAMRVWLRAGS